MGDLSSGPDYVSGSLILSAHGSPKIKEVNTGYNPSSPAVLLYKGPSRLKPSEQIICMATFITKNTKTGPMVQTWILPARSPPPDAARTGLDSAVCGTCPLRRTNAGGQACYVRMDHNLAVWYRWKRGSYARLNRKTLGWFKDVHLRLGAYGDPAALPLELLGKIMPLVAGHTGYTHQWRQHRFLPLRKWVLASVHSVAEANQAHAMGWRTYRIMVPGETLEPGEFICPAVRDKNPLTCRECLACNGGRPPKASIAVPLHGTPNFVANYMRWHERDVSPA